MFGKSENRDDYQRTSGPLAGMARDLSDGHVITPHRHRRAQLVYSTTGLLTVTTTGGAWTVPSNRAVWVPAGVEHAVRTHGSAALRTLYLDQDARADLPSRSAVLSVEPLLRELIEESTRIPVRDNASGRDGRVMSLLLHEIRPDPMASLRLPMPDDPVLAEICRAIVAEPGRSWSLAHCARRHHLGPRTLTRRFRAATGESFGWWLRQARLVAAVRMLSEGRGVTVTGAALGYASPSAFAAMFRRALGVPPSRFARD